MRELALATKQNTAVALQMDEAELFSVLRSSLYPGAKDESIKLVVGYCRAAGLDPMQKPVHIVPMKVKVGEYPSGDAKYESRDTVMPGVGLYRVQAARTGQYAGMDEPVFGEKRTLTYKKKVTDWTDGPNGKRVPKDRYIDATLEYPEWCKVVVYRVINGVRCPFPAVEFWLENYATAGRSSDAPNEMWERRVHGQLVKCTEAQALRKAFPEIGSQPTAEEMEGRVIDDEPAQQMQTITMPRSRSAASNTSPADVGNPEGQTATSDAPAAAEPTTAGAAESRPTTSGGGDKKASPGQIKLIRAKLEGAPIDEVGLLVAIKCEAGTLDDITIDQGNAALKHLASL